MITLLAILLILMIWLFFKFGAVRKAPPKKAVPINDSPSQVPKGEKGFWGGLIRRRPMPAPKPEPEHEPEPEPAQAADDSPKPAPRDFQGRGGRFGGGGASGGWDG